MLAIIMEHIETLSRECDAIEMDCLPAMEWEQRYQLKCQLVERIEKLTIERDKLLRVERFALESRLAEIAEMLGTDD